ncbi:unnamed protein product, partial [Adineta steineri]
MKSIIIIAIVLLGCVAFNEAIKCYQHDMCSANCPQLHDSIKTCGGDENKCYKTALPTGVKRGCAKDLCDAQANVGSTLANVCCEKDLCNSAVTP